MNQQSIKYIDVRSKKFAPLVDDLFLECNSEFVVVGVSKDSFVETAEIHGHSILSVLKEHEFFPEDFAKIHDAFNQQKPAKNLKSYLLVDDHLHPVSVSIAPEKECGFVCVLKDIRDFDKAERDKRNAEEAFNTLFEITPDYISLTDVESREYIDVNPAFCEFRGKEKTEFVGKPSLHLKNPNDRAQFDEVIKTLFRGDKPEPMRIDIMRSDGSNRMVRSHAALVPNSEGPRLLVVSEDVTTEHKLERNNDILSVTLETMQHGVSLYDENLDLVLCNHRFIDLLGFPEELSKAGTPFEAYMRYNAERGEYGPGDIDELVEDRMVLARKFEPHRFERVRPDGTVLDIEGRHVPGVGFISTYSDVTERVNAENEVRENEKLLREIVETLPFSFNLWDETGDRVLGNQYWNKWFPELDLSGKIVENYGELVREFIAKGLLQIGSQDVEKYIQDRVEALLDPPDGMLDVKPYGKKWLQIIDKKLPSGYIATFRIDVTEQHKQETQLRQAQKMEAVGQLTGGIAHDFNNILSVILGNVEFISDEIENENPLLKKRLLAMEKSALRGAELTQQLLSYSRKMELRPEPTNLNQAIRDMIVLLRSTLGEGVQLELDLQPGLWKCHVDPGQFENSLLNLSINARDAMNSFGMLSFKTENVELENRYFDSENEKVSGEFVRIVVSDSGEGIAEEHLKQIFEPFFTTKDVGKGSGLGLSMVFGFVRQSGGFITVMSKAGSGSSFEIFLPRNS